MDRVAGRVRLRDFSVTADCADTDPSLVATLQETDRAGEKHEDLESQSDWEVITALNRCKE